MAEDTAVLAGERAAAGIATAMAEERAADTRHAWEGLG